MKNQITVGERSKILSAQLTPKKTFLGNCGKIMKFRGKKSVNGLENFTLNLEKVRRKSVGFQN